MNDDLHDIDDLFRDRIENYSEDTPPSAWEAVSNNLDKQQASFYKSKYDRLKKAALVLSLLCFLGGMYVIFDVVKYKQVTTKQQQPDATTPSMKKGNEGDINKNNNSNDDVNKGSSNPQKKLSQREKNTPAMDTAAASFIPPVTAKQNRKPTEFFKKEIISNAPAMLSGVPVFTKEKKTGLAFTKDNVIQQTMKSEDEPFYFNQHYLLKPLQQLVLHKKDDSTITVNLQTSLEKHQPVLLQTNTTAIVKSKMKTVHGFSVSAFAAPNFSFDRFEEKHHRERPGGGNPDEEHRQEEKNVSLSGGVLLSYELGKNISLQSGIAVTTFSTSIAPKTIYAKVDNNGHVRYEMQCSLGYSYIPPKGNLQPGDSAITSGSISKLIYTSIPASLSYRISAGRFSFSPTVGAGINILTGSKIKTSLSDAAGSQSATTSISGLKGAYVDGHIGMGMEYKLTQKLSIGIRPNARLSLTPVNKETPVKSYQHFLSVETGIRIKL